MILFMIPHAGGSAKSYCCFKKYLPESIKVVPMEIAGRTSRSDEPFISTIKECAEDLLQRHIDTLKNEKYALFGHSMGTMIATELVNLIYSNNLPGPEHVFLSGRFAPDRMYDIIPQKNPSDDQIVSFFADNKMLPDSVINNKDILNLVSKIICADVRMTDGYTISPQTVRFRCDISIMYGQDDDLLKISDMSTWKRFADKKCSFYSFPGGHFYHLDDKKAVCKVISDAIGHDMACI